MTLIPVDVLSWLRQNSAAEFRVCLSDTSQMIPGALIAIPTGMFVKVNPWQLGNVTGRRASLADAVWARAGKCNHRSENVDREMLSSLCDSSFSSLLQTFFLAN